MKLRIPRFLANTWDRFGDWGDVPVIHYKGITIRRIDILIATGFLICTGYYWLVDGWLGALMGGALYVLITMIALWL